MVSNAGKVIIRDRKLPAERAVTPSERDIQEIFSHFKKTMELTSSAYESFLINDPTWYNEAFCAQLGEEYHPKIRVPGRPIVGKVARQASFFILNKIFSYHALRYYINRNYGLNIPNLYNPLNAKSMKIQLAAAFENLTKSYEVAPLFKKDGLYSSLGFSDSLTRILADFTGYLARLNFRHFTEDHLAEFYQILLPNESRKEYGQIYTPADIAELMARLTIKNPDQVVLDPACGCGTLLHKSYLRLKSLKGDSSPGGHSQLISQLWGVEINEFPSNLAMMTLAFQDVSEITENAGIVLEDFLNMGPMEKYVVKSKNLMTGEIITRQMPAKFDVIVGNPPYIKQEAIPDKKRMMKRLPTFASYRSKISSSQAGTTPPKIPKIKLPLTGKTDYYGFFLWYSTFFLKEGGRLGFIIPNKWLDVKYGEKIKEFLLLKYRIQAIIGFKKNVFEDAQVSTVILILDLESDPRKRALNFTKFVMLNEFVSHDAIDRLLNESPSASTKRSLDQDGYQFSNSNEVADCTLVPQKDLNSAEKWSIKYLFQSQFLRKFEKTSSIVLHNREITSVIGGIKTGANDFFFPNQEVRSRFQLEPELLLPGIKSGRKIPNTLSITVAPDKFLAIPPGIHLANFPGIAKYIKDCEVNLKYHERPSVNWKPWFSIPPQNQDCPDILFLRHINRDFRARLNLRKCIVADGVRGITITDPDHVLFYFGVCNSTFFYWQAHILGRWEGQGDLQLLVYELKQFRVPNVMDISPANIARVEKCATKLLEAGKTDALLRDLDLAVLSCFGLEEDY